MNGEGTDFTGVGSRGWGGTPIRHWRVTLSPNSGVLPSPDGGGGSTSISRLGGGVPSQDWMRVPPWAGLNGESPPPESNRRGVLDTQRALCLWRSHKRTFLFL